MKNKFHPKLSPVLLFAGLVFTCLSLHGQGGSVNFCNSSTTLITNGPANRLVTAADGIRAALYWAADGMDSNSFVQIGSYTTNVGVPLPGVFAGGTRFAGVTTTGGAQGQFQVKAWSGGYATYELAQSAGGVLLGQSAIVEVTTGNPGGTPPTPTASLVASGLTGFTLGAFFVEPPAMDIGLRAFDGTSTNNIGVQTGTPTSPLQINKNGTNYGVALVLTNDPSASKFRIQTSSGPKALMKLP